jgi:hypothetical protein
MGNCANRELFVQFLTRIYFEISGCKIGVFSKLKTLNSPNFDIFRNYFCAKLDKIFLCPAYTFDNVKGKFPIGFQIWDIEVKEKFKNIIADVYNEDGVLEGEKTICSYDDESLINDWIIATRHRENEKQLGFMYVNGNDFQHTNMLHIVNNKNQLPAPRGTWVTDKNLIEISIYLSVRHGIESIWLNDRDQFLSPNDRWKSDYEFQNNCLVTALFHSFNNIQSAYGTNHWIPFTEKEVGAKEKFESNFMSKFLLNHGVTQSNTEENGNIKLREPPCNSVVNVSPEAQAVLDAGRELWKYYHAKIKNNKTAPVNASFYDIREFFQGRKESGTMNTKSDDEIYNAIIKTLREKQKALAKKIEPKIYEYGFLKE